MPIKVAISCLDRIQHRSSILTPSHSPTSFLHRSLFSDTKKHEYPSYSLAFLLSVVALTIGQEDECDAHMVAANKWLGERRGWLGYV